VNEGDLRAPVQIPIGCTGAKSECVVRASTGAKSTPEDRFAPVQNFIELA